MTALSRLRRWCTRGPRCVMAAMGPGLLSCASVTSPTAGQAIAAHEMLVATSQPDADVDAPSVASSGSRASQASQAIQLEIPGQGAALVVVPRAGKGPRPVLVVSHGAWDRPEWYCAWWGDFIGDRAFVLCPRGKAIGAKVPVEQQLYFFPDHHSLEKEVLAGLEALHALYGDRVDPGPVVYVGFSQGAIMGALVVGLHPDLFPRAIFIEGGHHEWPFYNARLFARAGGQRVLFACGTGWCWAPAREQAHNLERAGVSARLLVAKGAGHTPQGAVGDQVRSAFSWVVESDPRWATLP